MITINIAEGPNIPDEQEEFIKTWGTKQNVNSSHMWHSGANCHAVMALGVEACEALCCGKTFKGNERSSAVIHYSRTLNDILTSRASKLATLVISLARKNYSNLIIFYELIFSKLFLRHSGCM